jgi:sRNA-binding carbon storage regulator CsrA
MLALTRRKNQSIIITTPSGEKITIHIAKNTNQYVRVGLDLPSKEYVVDRGEIHAEYEEIRKNAKLIKEA